MAYTAFDRLVAWRRFLAARPHIRRGARVCDIGCGSGAPFLRYLGSRIGLGVGLDCHAGLCSLNRVRVVIADITCGLPVRDEEFDHAVMLAVLEHLRDPEKVLREAFRILVPGGSLAMTWPNEVADSILRVLCRMKLVHEELGFDQHQPRIPLAQLKDLLRDIGFSRIDHGGFEFGVNNWLVAFKP